MIVAARDWPSLLVEWMHQKRLGAKHLHADETKLQVVNETSRKNTTNFYMWVYETGKHGIRPSVALNYAINKKRKLDELSIGRLRSKTKDTEFLWLLIPF